MTIWGFCFRSIWGVLFAIDLGFRRWRSMGVDGGGGFGGGGGGGAGVSEVEVVMMVSEQGCRRWRWWRSGGGGGAVVSEVQVVARRGKRLRGEDLGPCLLQEEVSHTFFNERSARKQTSYRHQTSARVCIAQT
ncbi:hypothetical protein HanRHA438_Chr16g0764061 [Helianthus annuus]|nr:hypothetical protein HanRHA438_Chr16g0764061 [Helianthus annuus]